MHIQVSCSYILGDYILSKLTILLKGELISRYTNK